MIVHRGLFRMFWRQSLPATVFGVIGLSAYSLLWPDVMTIRDIGPPLLILVQCLLLVMLLGRTESPAFSFIYSRGYSRDALWGHAMLASVLSVAVGWLPAALVVWSGLRSFLHDNFFQSPFFPIMSPFETTVPLIWLGIFVFLTSVFHYVWIRLAHPSKGGRGGFYGAQVLLLAATTAFILFNFVPGYIAWVSVISCVVVLVAVVLGARALHRNLEVRA
jgi:tryptophan-rich sensory protein